MFKSTDVSEFIRRLANALINHRTLSHVLLADSHIPLVVSPLLCCPGLPLILYLSRNEKTQEVYLHVALSLPSAGMRVINNAARRNEGFGTSLFLFLINCILRRLLKWISQCWRSIKLSLS